jgi:hypothetical protein
MTPMPDRSHSADRQVSDAGATRTAAAEVLEQHAQVAALDSAPPAADFGNAAGAVGLNGNMLSAELVQLMQVPVLPEPVSGERAVIPFSSLVTVAAADGGDPQMMLSVLTGLNLSDLMNLSVYSGLELLQELDAMRAEADDPFAAEFLHNMLSLSLPDLVAVEPL